MATNSVSLDKVTIQIVGSTEYATKPIGKLVGALNELRSATKGGFNNLSKLADSLRQLKSATSNLDKVSTNLESLSSIKEALSGLKEIPSPTGLTKTINNLQKLPSTLDKFDTKTLQNVARVSNELAVALTPLADKLAKIGSGFSAISALANKYGVSVTKITDYTKRSTNFTKEFNKGLSNLQTKVKDIQKTSDTMFSKLTKNTQNIISKVKQIGLSLLGTRTIFTATRKAVSEYMQMDAELTWQITNNWRALGAQLAPAIEYVIYLMKQFVRVVYSVILALTGIDLIARANEKAMKGWGKAAKDTLGNLQKFDDLNVVEFPKSSGGDDDSLIELDTIDLSPIQRVIDWVKKLKKEIKEAWNSGQWEGVGKTFAEGLNAGMEASDFTILEQKLKSVTKKFGDFLKGMVNNFDAKLFGVKLTEALLVIPDVLANLFDNIPWEDIGKKINDALGTFKPGTVISAIGDAVLSLVEGIQDAFLQIDPTVLGEKISDTIKSILSNIGDLLSNVEWGKLGEQLRTTIVNMDWKGIWDGIVNIAKEALSGLGEFVKELLGFDDGAWQGLWAAIVGIGVAFTTYKIVDSFQKLMLLFDAEKVSTFVTALSGMAVPLAYLAGIAIIAGGIYLIIKGIQDILEGDTFKGLSKVLIGISVVLLGIALIIGSVPLLIAAAIAFIVGIIVYLVGEIVKHWDEIKEAWNNLWTKAGEKFNKFKDKISEGFSKIKEWWKEKITQPFNEAITNIKTKFSNTVDNVKKAFGRLGDFFSDFWTALKGGPKTFFNFLMEKYEWLLNKLIDGLNWLKRQINKLSFDVPDWVPGIGGKTMGFNLQMSDHISLPRLEVGTNEIKYEGAYYLHPGEAVVPKKYNPALAGGTNEETNERLDRLIDIIGEQQHTTIVNIGNRKVFEEQKRYNDRKVNKYGTIAVE